MSEKTAKARIDLEELIGELAEEFAQRLREGEKPHVDEYVRRYPEAAEDIRQILPALEIMGESPESNDVSSRGEPDERGMLGDFRILREIGRGGMGVVYEAEQLSLSRHVALKVLPFAALLDERQIKRFRNEAMAAAQLDHPHVVEVYGVGCERSIHFYSMRLIEGQSLSSLIDDLRLYGDDARKKADGEAGAVEPTALFTPTKEVSDRPPGADERAEDLGSPPQIAKDTRPLATLSTERTASGRALFANAARIGIEVAEALDHAHQQGVIHRDIKPANILLDGAGKSWVADFGLARMESAATMTMTGDLIGTMRYMSPEQAMAKRVVVDHRTDVYSLGVTLYELLTLRAAFPDEDRHELLRRIAFEDPPHPRKINPRIPVDLNTVVLRAIAKSPDERYDSARELAEDLRRFLKHEPIKARRPTLLQWVAKWIKRHPAIVTSTGVVLLVILVALASSTALLSRKQAALIAQQQATRQHATRAQDHLRIAINTIDGILTKVAEQELADAPHLSSIRHAMIHRALELYDQLLLNDGDDPEVRYQTAMAAIRAGRLHADLDRHDRSKASYRRSINLLDQLHKGEPERASSILAMAQARRHLAASCRATNDFDDAERAINLAIRQLEGLLAQQRSDFKSEMALACREAALLYRLTSRHKAAESMLRQALRLQEQLVRESPEDAGLVGEVLRIKGWLVRDLDKLGRGAEKEKAYSKLIQQFREAASRFPTADLRHNFAVVLSNRGVMLMRSRPDRAEAAFREAIPTLEKLVREFPLRFTFQRTLAINYSNLGALLFSTQRREEAEVFFAKAMDHLKRPVEDHPDVPTYRAALAATMNNAALVYLAAPATRSRGLSLVKQAIGHQTAALRRNPANEQHRRMLANQYLNLVRAHASLGRHDDAWAATIQQFQGLPKDWDALFSCLNCLEKGLQMALAVERSNAAESLTPGSLQLRFTYERRMRELLVDYAAEVTLDDEHLVELSKARQARLSNLTRLISEFDKQDDAARAAEAAQECLTIIDAMIQSDPSNQQLPRERRKYLSQHETLLRSINAQQP